MTPVARARWPLVTAVADSAAGLFTRDVASRVPSPPWGRPAPAREPALPPELPRVRRKRVRQAFAARTLATSTPGNDGRRARQSGATRTKIAHDSQPKPVACRQFP